MTDLEIFDYLFKDKVNILSGDCEVDGAPGTIVFIKAGINKTAKVDDYDLSLIFDYNDKLVQAISGLSEKKREKDG